MEKKILIFINFSMKRKKVKFFVMKKKYISAVILCGGKGTRLGVLGKKLPKTLVKVNNKPIIWYIIKFLEKNSFNHFILPVGHKGK